MRCKDKSITYLRSYGYNVVRLPKADMKPLEILTKSKDTMTRLGALSVLITPGSDIPYPQMTTGTPSADVSGKSTSDLSLDVGLSILGSVISAMGGSKLGLETKYEKARSIAFEFTEVEEDAVQVVEVDQFLGNGTVNPHSTYISKLLEADDVFLITSTLKSKKVLVEGKKKDGTALTVEAPIIKEVVGGNIGVSHTSGSESKLAYEGNIPLIFGFQAIRLFYENGRYTAFETLQPGGGAVAAHVPDNNAQYLVTETPLATLVEF